MIVILTFYSASFLRTFLLFAAVATLSLSFGQGQPKAGQTKKMSSDDVIVATRMNLLPKNLHLTARQKLQLREAFLDTAHKESHVMHTVSGFFRQRVLIAPIAHELVAKEKKILTPAQFNLVTKNGSRPTGLQQ